MGARCFLQSKNQKPQWEPNVDKNNVLVLRYFEDVCSDEYFVEIKRKRNGIVVVPYVNYNN